MGVCAGSWSGVRQALSLVALLASLSLWADATVTLAAATHGAEPSTNGLFTLTRDDTAGVLVVNLTVAGTATAGSDYTALAATASFADGDATTTVSVAVLDDALIEAPESIIVRVASGTGYTVGTPGAAAVWLTSDEGGRVLGMGANSFGWLGTGNTNDSSTPVAAIGAGASGVVAIAAGAGHSLFLKTDGSVWATGANGEGQLGDGSDTNSDTPLAVTGAGTSGVVAVAAGNSHSLFLKADGSLWAMGFNSAGQLGDGGNTNQNTPVAVTGAGTSGVVAMAGGNSHSLFLKADGSLWAMGSNTKGQLGDGSTTIRHTPVAVTGAGTSGVVAVAGGGLHSLFLKADGSVWAMGFNGSGQLGNDSTTDQSTPVAVTGEGTSGVVAVAAGTHGLFLKTDGSLWAMGNNGNGQLGDGTTTGRNTPVAVIGAGTSGAVAVAANSFHSLFLDPPPPTVTIVSNDDSAAEPADGGNFRVYRTGPTTYPLTVTITIGGTATRGVDYVLSAADNTKVMTIAPGRDYIGVGVPVLDDALLEGDETIVLTVEADASYEVGSPSVAAITISDDGVAGTNGVSVAASGPSAAEPGTPGAFTLSRTGDSTAALSVSVALTGTASAGSDYTTIASTLEFLAGESTLVVPVTVLDEALGEADETVILTVQTGAGYHLLSPNQATVTIVSEDVVVSVVANDASAGEPANHGSFLVRRTGPLTGALAVTVTMGGSASQLADYTYNLSVTAKTTRIVKVPAGRASIGVQITVVDDLVVEAVETVTMTVAAGAGYLIGSPNTATVTVTSDDLAAPDLDLAPGIHSVTPTATALGNELVIHGVGLSAKRVSASLLGHTAKGKVKRYALQVLEASDTQVRVRVKSGRVGDYLVELRLRGGATYQSVDAVSLLAPVLTGISPEAAQAGDEITLQGLYFGSRCGSVSIGGQRAKVLSWTDDAVTVRVPAKLRTGTHAIIVRTRLGTSAPDSPVLTLE